MLVMNTKNMVDNIILLNVKAQNFEYFHWYYINIFIQACRENTHVSKLVKPDSLNVNNASMPFDDGRVKSLIN